MESVGALFDQLVVSFEHLGVHAYWILFLIALLDSLIITGTFTNGAAFLLLAGIMVSRGTHEFATMALFAAAGAIVGGLLSYYFGYVGSNLVHIKRHAVARKHTDHGESLIQKFGGLGVFMGRFFGPVSSVVAFLAGAGRMSRTKFILWNTLAGLTWGVGYVTIGAMFGDSLSSLHLL